jgi:hypothetical protein
MTITRTAAIGAAVLFAALATFQLALVLGAPWGQAAYGGLTEHPGVELRVSSAVASLVWASAALVVLKRAGFTIWAPLPRRTLRVAVWVLVGLTTLAVVPNAISPSVLERSIWVPWAVATTALLLTVAISARKGAGSRVR